MAVDLLDATGTATPPTDLLDASTPQMQGSMRLPAMAGSEMLAGLQEGGGQFGDSRTQFQHLLSRLTGAAPDGAIKYVPSPFSLLPGMMNLGMSGPTSAETIGATDKLGLTDRPDLAPEGKERYLAAGARGLGAAAPYVAMSGPGAVLPTLLGGVGGGAGSLLGSQWEDHPAIGGLLGALGGAVTAGGAGNLFTKLGSAISGDLTPTLAAMRRLFIEPRLIGDATGSRMAQAVQSVGERLPLAKGRVSEAAADMAEQFGDAVDRTADTLGQSATPMEAGKALQSEGEKWLTQFKKNSGTAWDAVDQAIPGDTRVDLSTYKNTLGDVLDHFTEAKATGEQLQSPLSKNLLDSLQTDLKGGTTLPWADVKAIRTEIGAKLATPQLVGDTNYTELKRIYAALSMDMEGAAHQQGALTEFQNAAQVTRNGHAFVKDTLSDIMGKDPEKAAEGALKSDSTLQSIRAEMPKAADELGAYHLRKSATPPDSARTAEQPYSPYTLNTNLGPRHLTPEARGALYGGNPDVTQAVNDLETVGGAVKDTINRYRNFSGTASATAHDGIVGSVIKAAGAAALGHEVAGVKGALIGAGTVAGPMAAGVPVGLAAAPPRSLLGVPVAKPLLNMIGARGAPNNMKRSLLLGADAERRRLLGAPQPAPEDLSNQYP